MVNLMKTNENERLNNRAGLFQKHTPNHLKQSAKIEH